jgi:membrane-bound acyltransferase YfiQ involved in biofilm formation
MLVFAALIHRPIGNLYPLQSVIYFAPVYAFGILFSIYKDRIYWYLKDKEIYLLILILSLASLQVVLFDHYGNYLKSPFVMSEPDLIIFQKMLMCMFFMVFLHRFENKKLIIFDRLASASFAIFFLHPFVIYMFFHIISKMKHIEKIPESVLWLLIFPAVVLSSMAIAKVIKTIFRSHSRQVIGW